MNINEIKIDIEDHKNRLNEKYSDSLEITLPLFKLFEKMMAEISKMESNNFGLNNSEFDVLITTLVCGDENYIISPSKLYDRLLFSTGAITKILNKLESKELIIRLDNELDKRGKLLQLTPKGVKVCEDMFEQIASYQENVYNVLTKNERDNFIKSLFKMLKQL